MSTQKDAILQEEAVGETGKVRDRIQQYLRLLGHILMIKSLRCVFPNFCKDNCGGFSRCQDNIAQLDKKIASLEAKQLDLEKQEEILAMNTSRASIRKLPNEVLTIIFKYLVYEDQMFTALLWTVCRLWRQIVLNTPTLWTKVKIYAKKNTYSGQYLKKVQNDLQRSKGSNIRIDLDMTFSKVAQCNKIITLIEPHMHRCIEFNITVSSWEAMEQTSICWKILFEQKLQRTNIINLASERTISTTSPFQNSSLTLLELALVSVPPSHIRGPLPALRKLEIHSEAPENFINKDVINLLSTTPLIEDLRFAVVCPLDVNGTQTNILPTVNLPQLVNLALENLKDESIEILIRSIHCHRLQTLSILADTYTYRDDQRENTLAWLELLSTGHSHLTHLELHGYRIDEPSVMDAFSNLQQISMLALSASAENNDLSAFFNLLTCCEENVKLPNLQGIWLNNFGDMYGPLYDMLMARKKAGLPIQTLRITNEDRHTRAEPHKLQRLREIVEFFEFDTE